MLEPEGVEEYSALKLNEGKTGSEYHHTDLEEDEDELPLLKGSRS